MIEVTVRVPSNVAASLGATPEAVARQILESAAIDGYRENRLSRGQVRDMLGMDWQGTEDFLAQHNCVRHYSVDDLDEDRSLLTTLPVR